TGTEFADTINGGAGNDTLNGGAGNDIIRTGTFNGPLTTEVVDGGIGNDEIHIESGANNGSIAGGVDDDTIYAETTAFGGGIDGGSGSDTLIFTNQFTNNYAGATFQGIEKTDLFGTITIDTAQASGLGSIELINLASPAAAQSATVTLAAAGTGVF